MLEPGANIDIWVVEKPLGAGGMGSVYRCHNRTANRILAAVKVLDGDVRRHPESEARFIREAEILFQLDHPNIVKVRNVRTDSEPPYLEMEFVAGDSLEAIMARGPMPTIDALALIEQLLSAIAYLHERGVRHRDIKPANVLIRPDGRVKIVDFGLAVETHGARITQAGMAFGTVSYSPPEWITPDKLDPCQWDLYAVGVILWEMLLGKHAFPTSGTGSARQQAMQVIVSKQGHPSLDPGPAYPDDLRAIVAYLTHPDPDQRARSATEVHRQVRALLRAPSAGGATLLPTDISDGDLTEQPSIVGNAPVQLTPPKRKPTPAQNQPTPAQSSMKNHHLLKGPAETRGSGPQDKPGTNQDTWLDDPTMETSHASADASANASRQSPPSAANPTPTIAKTPASKRRRGWWVPVLALSAFAGLALFALLVAIAAWVWLTPATSPTVALVIEGVPDELAVTVTLDGEASLPTSSGTFVFPQTTPGSFEALIMVGDGCVPAACPGDGCPAWCLVESRTVDVTANPARQNHTFSLQGRVERTVTLTVTGGPPDDAVIALGAVEGRLQGGRADFERVAIGRHQALLESPSCPADARGCSDTDTCPAGCVSLAGSLDVPPGAGPFAHTIELPELIAVATIGVAPPKPAPTSVAPPKPAPAAPATGTGKIVTASAFAAWISANPDFERQAAIAKGHVDSGYLRSWADGSPPTASAPVTDVSWLAASAYCVSRGGLAAVDSPPLQWDGGSGLPILEWRQDNGKVVARDSTGSVIREGSPTKTNSFTGFRCAR